MPHIDIGHIDVPPPHIDIAPPHIDINHTDTPTPPHVDIPPPHGDAAPPHGDVGYNHWWQNWPKTHRYIAARMSFPTSVDEIASQVKAAESDQIPLRAVGGGWSFSDAALPGNVGPSLASQPLTDRPDVKKSDSISRLLPLAQGFPGDDQPSIASIDANNGWLIGYDEKNVRLLGGATDDALKLVVADLLTLPQPQPAYLMNTRSLKSSLQVHLGNILSEKAQEATAPGSQRKHYFHVEAGITMEELNRLLDAQSPRLELRASGGNRGATLAGALSTSTHGAEFRTPLLSDRVKAVHLVGPGGQQWWIEGTDSIADITKLQQIYPGLDPSHIIAGDAPINDLLPQDWLNAVAVSMGCMGVIYSVVLEVFPLSGSQMVTTQTTWFSFLQAIQVQDPSLPGGNMWHNRQNPDSTWTGFNEMVGAPGNQATDIAAARRPDGGVDVVMVGLDGNMWHNRQNPDSTWTGFNEMVGTSDNRATKIAVAPFSDGRLDVYMVELDGNMWHNRQNPDSTWTGFNEMVGAPGNQATDIAAARRPDGGVDVVMVGLDGNMWHNRQNPDSTWTGFNEMVGTSDNRATKIAVAPFSDGRLDVYMVELDGNMWHNRQNPDSTWTGFNEMVGAPGNQATDIAAARRPDGGVDVVMVGLDGNMWHNRQNPDSTWTGFNEMVGTSDNRATKIAVAPFSDGRLDVYMVGLESLNIQQLLAALRDPAHANHKAVNNGIADAITTKASFSQGLIPGDKNEHGEMAFNPNPASASSQSLAPADFDCWVVYRQAVPIPHDPQPPGGGGMAAVFDAVSKELEKEFGIAADQSNLSTLVNRLAVVYKISKPFHVDVSLPGIDLGHIDLGHIDLGHVDVAPPHIDFAPIDFGHVDVGHVDVSPPHIDFGHVDVSPPHIDVGHVDVSPPHIDFGHIDVPPPHIDFGHIDFGHVDVGHVDVGHGDVSPPHIDVGHVDVSPPHIDVGHVDVSPPHIDVGHADVGHIDFGHVDVAPPHIDVGHIDFGHVDVAHIDLNSVLEGLVQGVANPLAGLLTSAMKLAPGAAPILKQLILGGFDLHALTSIITTIANAHDTLDVALDAITAPMADAEAMDLARPFLTGFLAATMGTANEPGFGVSIATEVGAIGFPNGGVLGAGIEIALPLDTAFGFLQTQVLDKMERMDPNRPLFGYVSVRLCPQTATLLGMQQWGPISVMIEVVSFGDYWGNRFISELQSATLAYMAEGKDAMLHFGLENDQMAGKHLESIPVLIQPSVAHGTQPPVTKLEAFKLVRSLLFTNNRNNAPGLFPAFNNSFTARLKLE